MSHARKNSYSGLPELEKSKDTEKATRKRDGFAFPFISVLSTLLEVTQMIAIWAAGMLKKLTHLVSNLLKSTQIKKSTTIAALVMAAILAGHSVSAQVNGPPPLGGIEVPKPKNLTDFVKDEKAAIALGKSLFWDMQLGYDGIQSCASCHFNAGADSRSKNQISPGFIDRTFTPGKGPNYQLTAVDYPFHKLANPDDISSTVVSDNNDVAGSQGVFRARFVDVNPGSDKDKVTPLKDQVFNVNGTNVRQVTPRHSPSVINAVFNFRNFWDGLAQNTFNGVNPLGLRDSNAYVLKAVHRKQLEDVQVSLNNSSLASQAVGPPENSLETSAELTNVTTPLRIELSGNDTTVKVFDTLGRTVNNTVDAEVLENITNSDEQASRLSPGSNNKRFRRVGRKLGKKFLALKPLAKQIVAYDDSVLGSLSNSSAYSSKPGLKKSYEALLQDAFKREWWDSDMIIKINPQTGRRTFSHKKGKLNTNEFTLAEYNFSLFFGLAVQAYESTLVSAETPFDQFLAGNSGALTAQQQLGWNVFQNKGTCIACHAGSELTAASVTTVAQRGRIGRAPVQAGGRPEDSGFFSIGVRPSSEDPGLGGNDGLNGNGQGNPLSEVRLAQQGKFKQLLGEDPPTLNPPLDPNEAVTADGAFKTPGLRNIELTAPYFHNGGQSTLEQVVDFYNRGGDFGGLPPLNLTPEEKQGLVAFMKGLTDERVRNQKAPFDHPQLFIPNGHPGNQNSVTIDPNVKTQDGTTQATDSLLEIPAVGQNGGNPLPKFLATS
ncbi:cytochrome C peroxidase [Brasilonema octagenarum UFV-E1]|uniref:Cytochrome C peroxidase n=1 Tax=Brasilonema sennae CENA114 TaxID=415709 RepID=A0A856MHJ1_9CYAN|nr:cytochrome c peroxidase [Brasilonema sennae]QDL10713.1 cytochrome C peroxidase [Brasilonema sennae CENA114]QDL17057.1 cytochrome C peroxidase [Brasilonema octagenarum UFV-E1]